MIKIRQLREERNLKQEEVAQAINASLRTYQRYEYGEREPSAKHICMLANYFNITTDYLLGLSETSELIIREKKLLDNESAMLDAFRKCSSEAQIYLLNKAKVMAYEEQHKGMDEEAATGEEDAVLLA